MRFLPYPSWRGRDGQRRGAALMVFYLLLSSSCYTETKLVYKFGGTRVLSVQEK